MQQGDHASGGGGVTGMALVPCEGFGALLVGHGDGSVEDAGVDKLGSPRDARDFGLEMSFVAVEADSQESLLKQNLLNRERTAEFGDQDIGSSAIALDDGAPYQVSGGG